MKKLKRTIFIIAAVLLLCSCGKKDAFPLYILTIWDAPKMEDGYTLDFSQASEQVQQERSGFVKAANDISGNIDIYEFAISERQDVISYMGEIAAYFRSTDTMMAVGANTDIGTMYLEGEADFFNVPILSPFVDGDLFDSGTVSHGVNLSPAAEDYAEFFSQHIYEVGFNRQIDSYLFADSAIPDYSVKAGIFFPDDFSGHNTAVLVGQVLMTNGADLEVYSAYPENYLEQTIDNSWKNDTARMNNLDIVVIVGKYAQEKSDLSRVVESWQDCQTPPSIFVCGMDAFNFSDDLLKYDNLYFLRRTLDMSNCPADITTYEEAMGYAAGYIAASALLDARENPPASGSGFFDFLRGNTDKAEKHRLYIEAYRDNVSSSLRNLGGKEIPCLGTLSYAQDGNVVVPMGLFRYKGNNQMELADETEIFNRVVRHIREEYNVND